jgi:ABC-type polysaccharide/polyol phosphate transport system ATPase subunit
VLAVGDLAFQKKCFDVFERFKREGKTVVFVSNDLSVIERFADRCVLLYNGKSVIGKANEMISL